MIDSELAGMVAAGESNGLVSKKEARLFLTLRQLKRRLSDGKLIEILPRVYRVLGAPETWRQSLGAIQLWDKRTVFSHRTAAALHGFELFKGGPLEVISRLKLRVPDGLTVHRGVLLRSECTEVDDLPVTKVPRTLIDLMASTDWYTMKTTIDQALREKKATVAELEAAATVARRRPGIVEFNKLLAEFTGEDGPTESELEDLCLDLIADAGLPTPKKQWPSALTKSDPPVLMKTGPG